MAVVLWDEEVGFGSGDPTVSLSGSGEAIPRGVEAVFRYNGLYLNDRSVIDKYRIISIDGLSDADVRDSREAKPESHGEDLGNSLYGGRTLAINGRVEAYELHKLREMQQALRTAFADISSEKPLHFLTGNLANDHFINCKKFTSNQWGEEQKHDNHFFRDFLITVRASNPRFYRSQPVQITLDGITPGNSVLVNFLSRGNFESQPLIKMVGPLSKFTITDQAGTQFRLKDTAAIPEGTFYLLDTSEPTLIDNLGNSRFGKVDSSYETDLKVYGKYNAMKIEVDADGTANENSAVQIVFRDSYI